MMAGRGLRNFGLRRDSSIVWLLPLAGAVACGGEGGGGAVDDTGGPGITVTATEGDSSATAGGSADDGVTGGQDSTGGTCPAARMCEAECCAEGEACIDGACQIDCGTDPACGEVCCDGAAGEICYVGACIVPGAACDAAVCATKTETTCARGEICDANLGQCVPNFADPTCAFEPEVGVFDPVPRFTWGVRAVRDCADGCQKEEVCVAGVCDVTWPHVAIAADDFPESHQVVMSPMVADLDGDCVPEIIFNSYQNSAYTNNGILRAIRGDTGARVWTLGDAAYRTDPGSHPAIGDIDMDGTPEVIVPGAGSNLIAVDGDGTPLWASENHGFGGRSGSPSLADFDGQGPPEIAYGRAIWDAQGNIVWEAASGATGANGSVGPLSCVADLDGDDRPELIAGATVYTFTGTVGVDFAGSAMWTGTPADGYCGVADFDGDGDPEVALVSSANIYLFDGPTGMPLGSFAIPGGGAGGPPNIADFDGDGSPDLGTAAANVYVVVTYDAVAGVTELWRADTKDGSSQRTGSSVFDFDGDGRSEVIYADEWYIRIYPGTEPSCPGGAMCDGVMTDEEILFIDINSSRTRSELPVVADVDGDFKAEIVVSTNNESSQGAIGDAGVEVFEDRLDNWVSTLPIWNQHSYHVTNVTADGSVPSPEPPNWSTPAGSPYNSYRRNAQGSLEQLCAPDLVPSDFTVDPIACPQLSMSVRVLNQGCLGVGPGVNVAFYEDTLGLLGVVQTQAAIPAGGSETVTLEVMDLAGGPYSLRVVVDDDGAGAGALNECHEDNNESEPVESCMPIG
jgi:hypothetical protein